MSSVLAAAFPDPTSPTLDNEGFADLVIVVLAGVIIVWAAWKWFSR